MGKSKQTKQDYMIELSNDIHRLTHGNPTFRFGDEQPAGNTWLWDRESLFLLERQSSGLKSRLGNMPIVPDVRAVVDLPDRLAELQAKADAGCGGDCGDL